MDEQVCRVVGIDRIDGDTGAGAREDRRAAVADRLVDLVEDPPGKRLDVLGRSGRIEDHHEFVSAEPHAKIRCAAGAAHPLRGFDEHQVAGRMPEGVVDLLEPVEIELQDRQPFVSAMRAFEQGLEMVGQECAIVQACQAVMDGDVGHRVAGRDQFLRAMPHDLRHRPENHQRDQHDDADRCKEQPPMKCEKRIESHSSAVRNCFFQRGVSGHCR